MNGNRHHRIEAMQRIENLHAALRTCADNARRVIDTTRRLQALENARCNASMQRLDDANKALHASACLME